MCCQQVCVPSVLTARCPRLSGRCCLGRDDDDMSEGVTRPVIDEFRFRHGLHRAVGEPRDGTGAAAIGQLLPETPLTLRKGSDHPASPETSDIGPHVLVQVSWCFVAISRTPLTVNCRPKAGGSRSFQASKKRLIAVLSSSRVHTLAVGVPEAAPRSVAGGRPAGDGRPEPPVQLAGNKIRAGKTTSPPTAARQAPPGDHAMIMRALVPAAAHPVTIRPHSSLIRPRSALSFLRGIFGLMLRPFCPARRLRSA
jgi:hypothetical protein